jgi:hypothetical protein
VTDERGGNRCGDPKNAGQFSEARGGNLTTASGGGKVNVGGDTINDIRRRIERDYPHTINTLHQNRHIAGTAEYDPARSTLTEDPANLIALYSGKGAPILSLNGNWTEKERFEHTSEIGFWRDLNGTEAPTKRGIIRYSKKNGIHVVPAKPG